MRFVYLTVVFFIVGIGLFAINFDSLVMKAIERNPDKLAVVLKTYAEYKKAEAEKHKILAQAKEPIFVDTTDAPKKGSSEAKYKFVIFTDYQCGYCGKVEETIAELETKYGKDMQIAYKHLPLAFHREAEPAARAAWAAGQQAKFFEYSKELFEHQKELEKDLYVSIAKDLGLNMNKFKLDQSSSKSLESIKKDKQEAKELGFTGTPIVLVNGIPVRGAYPLGYFENVLQVLDGQAD